MATRLEAGILGTALLLGVGTARVSPAQEQGAGPSISESESAKSKSSSPIGATPEINQAAETSAGRRKGLGLPGRFLADQKEIWTGPAKLGWADADWILPLAGLSATLFATDASFTKSQSNAPPTIQHYKRFRQRALALWPGRRAGCGC